jgi:hypothetical protein
MSLKATASFGHSARNLSIVEARFMAGTEVAMSPRDLMSGVRQMRIADKTSVL